MPADGQALQVKFVTRHELIRDQPVFRDHRQKLVHPRDLVVLVRDGAEDFAGRKGAAKPIQSFHLEAA